MRFSGAVLAGGSSSRMGRDKALLDVTGRPLALVAADALRAAGASEVHAVGGDASALAALGLQPLADLHPGAGPLGGIITALRASDAEVVMVLACDMPTIDGPTVARIVAALEADPGSAVAAPLIDGRRQILTAAYRRRVLPVLEAAFAGGERAPRRALDGVEVTEVTGLDPARLGDVDRPEDLRRYARPDRAADDRPLPKGHA